MSGLLDKRPDGASRRQTRVDKEHKEKTKVRVITVSVVVVLALLFAGAMFINSKFIRRTLTAVSFGDVNFTSAEYDYFYITASNDVQNSYISYFGEEEAQQYLPSGDASLSSQINPQTGDTWDNYFAEMTLTNMSNLAATYSAAVSDGFQLTGEAREEIDNQIEALRTQAEMYKSVFPTFNSFLQQNFGNSINEAALRKIMERSFIASEYSKHINDSFTYNANELASHYSDNADTLDKFDFRYFTVYTETETEDGEEPEYESEEESKAANEAALVAARAKAADIVSGISSVDDFLNAAKEYNEIYSDPEYTLFQMPGSNLDSMEFADWMRDSSRAYGDVTSVDMDTGAFVLFYIGRDKNDYRTVSMRQIVVVPESVNIDPSTFELGEEDPAYTEAYDEAVKNAEVAAKERADTVLALFTQGGATEEKLLELMDEYSSDKNTEGGLYEDIYKGYMPIAVEEWLFAPERQVGDYSMIETAGVGHQLVFFKGYGDRYCDIVSENELRGQDYEEWSSALNPVDAVKHWAFSLTQKH